jgi:hypothetical protein
LLIKNIKELQEQLQLALETSNAETYNKACHKAKTTLGMLGDEEFTNVIDTLESRLSSGVFRETQLITELSTFKTLCIKITEGLEEEIRSI